MTRCNPHTSTLQPMGLMFICLDQDDKVAKKNVDMTQLKLRKAKEMSWSPIKNFMMTAFMLACCCPPAHECPTSALREALPLRSG